MSSDPNTYTGAAAAPLATGTLDVSVAVPLPPATARGLELLAERAGHVPAAVPLAGFWALLLRWSGHEEVQVDTSSGPLRCRTDEETTFRQLIEQAARATRAAGATSASYRAVVPHPLVTAGSAHELRLSCSWGAQGIHCALECASGTFSAAELGRFAAQLSMLLTNGTIRPDQYVQELGLITAEERRAAVGPYNDTARFFDDSVLLHQLVEAQVTRTPDAVAVRCGAECLTYRQLDALANGLAHRLTGLGVSAGTPVGVCVGRDAALIWSLLGVLKAGGVHIPLDPDYPAERLWFMIEDSGAALVVTQEQQLGAMPEGIPTVLVGKDASEADGLPDIGPEPRTMPDDLAYVLYTSGSTGRPKGVQLTHRSLSNRLQEMRRQYALTEHDRVLQFASVSFDAAAEQIFPALMCGGSLILRDSPHWGPEEVVATLRTARVTVAELPVALWEQVIPLLAEHGTGDWLRLLVLAGETISPGSVANWFAVTSVPIHTTYAPTEATITATTYVLDRPGPVLIGTPVANTHVCVMDRAGGLVPAGVPGELWIGGVGVTRGYGNQPALTAERFVPHPFATGERMYRSGDLVRQLPDGALEILGRIDTQVKLRGQRVELGEVESTLVAHTEVASAVAAVREDTPGDKRLVAYCVPAPGHLVDARALREHCRRTLPEYMVPSVIAVLDALPLTPNGKVDRRALPAPDPDAQTPDDTFVAPRNEVEQAIANVWAEILGTQRIGLRDNFFDLGGHSLLATRLTNRIEALTGVTISLVDLFRGPTVEALSRQVLERFAELEHEGTAE
ncbi:amino acid adenylation domain-containing protein [Streptomyces sp. Isolate_45]|uniref:non-ribosomal peptide synthetase n=1 Tax=Streptomyces sp. Isolate_45 TaxID=2950111 RepID=UPI002481BD25|nr:amino acid adenylation domain-containing protein [Streptomyces sp. Isolate_45]MDA5286075.1 amino acid adenylation domain-containing protein [Streptomyces sp. Isolate_45]